MIQKEYGWSDEYILELPFVRFLQIKDQLMYRLRQEMRFKLRLEEKKLQITCQFIAANSSDGKVAKSNVSAAKSIKLLEEEVENEIQNRKDQLKPGGFENALALFSKFGGRG